MADGPNGVIAAESDVFCCEDGFEAAITELSDGEEGTIAEGRKNVCFAGCHGEMQHWEEGGVCGLDAGAIWEGDLDAIGDWLEVGARAVEAQEMRGAARVCNSCGGSVGRGSESYGAETRMGVQIWAYVI